MQQPGPLPSLRRDLHAAAAERRVHAADGLAPAAPAAALAAAPAAALVAASLLDLDADALSHVLCMLAGPKGERTLPGLRSACQFAGTCLTIYNLVVATPCSVQKYVGEYIGDGSVNGSDPDGQAFIQLAWPVANPHPACSGASPVYSQKLKPQLTMHLNLARSLEQPNGDINKARIKVRAEVDLKSAEERFFKPPAWEDAARFTVCQFPDERPPHNWSKLFSPASMSQKVTTLALRTVGGTTLEGDIWPVAQRGVPLDADEQQRGLVNFDLTQSVDVHKRQSTMPFFHVACSTDLAPLGVNGRDRAWFVPDVEVQLKHMFSNVSLAEDTQFYELLPRDYAPIRVLLAALESDDRHCPDLVWQWPVALRELAGFRVNDLEWVHQQLPQRKPVSKGSSDFKPEVLPEGTKRGAAIAAVSLIAAAAAQLAAPESSDVRSAGTLPAHRFRAAPKPAPAVPESAPAAPKPVPAAPKPVPGTAIATLAASSLPHSVGRQGKSDEGTCRLECCLRRRKGKCGGSPDDPYVGGFCSPIHRQEFFENRDMPVPLRKNWRDEEDWDTLPDPIKGVNILKRSHAEAMQDDAFELDSCASSSNFDVPCGPRKSKQHVVTDCPLGHYYEVPVPDSRLPPNWRQVSRRRRGETGSLHHRYVAPDGKSTDRLGVAWTYQRQLDAAEARSSGEEEAEEEEEGFRFEKMGAEGETEEEEEEEEKEEEEEDIAEMVEEHFGEMTAEQVSAEEARIAAMTDEEFERQWEIMSKRRNVMAR